MFISSYTTIYFFLKNFFSNVYISVNTKFECSYLLLGWEIGHPLSMYATGRMEVAGGGGGGGVIQNEHRCVQGEGVEKSVIRYARRTKWMAPNKCCGIFFVH